MRVEEEAREVVDAYAASVRLRLYALLAFLLGVVGFVAVAGGMIVGSINTEVGVAALAGAAVVATATAGTLYDQSFRTRLSAASLERGIDTDEDLHAAVPVAKQRAKTVSLVVAAICAVLVVGILAFSFENAGTERDDDDRTGVEAPDKPDGDDKGDD